MHLQKIKRADIQEGDFIIIQAPFPDDQFRFRFQYSGTALVGRYGIALENCVIDKFNRKGRHVRTTVPLEGEETVIFKDGVLNDTYFKVVL